MKRLLVLGAGAVGRSFLPWIFPRPEFEMYFVDKNRQLMKTIREEGCTSYRVRSDAIDLPRDRNQSNNYDELLVKGLDEPPVEFDAVFTAVGPRNFLALADRLMGTKKPVICCENDRRLPRLMSEYTGNPNVYFAIPDVITSNTAPLPLAHKDRYATVTENGTLYIEKACLKLGGKAVYLDDRAMDMEWMAKLYIHNTSHCIAAYLGWQNDCYWVWQAMSIPKIYATVEGAMRECEEMIVKMYGVDPAFAHSYSEKELARFSNKSLYDPVSRVAREPLRKLARGDRLIGAAMLCLQANIMPDNILKGIAAALAYTAEDDPDYETMERYQKMKVEEILPAFNVSKKETLFSCIANAVRGAR